MSHCAIAPPTRANHPGIITDMADDHAYQTLYRQPGISVGDFRCSGRSCGEAEEWSSQNEIVFIRRGVFEKRVGPRIELADASRVLFFPAGQAYRVRHPVPGGDECTVINLDDAALRQVVAGHDERLADGPGGLFPVSSCPVGSATHLAHWRMLRTIRRKQGDSPALGEMLLSLVDEVLSAAFDRRGRRQRPVRASTRRAHRDLADAVIRLLHAGRDRSPTVDDIAVQVHSSPFHLSRVFKRCTGLPIHRYLTRIRLRAAVERLADGADDLTRLALDLGFSSRGHFGDAFRREFGTTPSAVRRRLRA